MREHQFRSRTIDVTHRMPVFLEEELQVLLGYSIINTAVPQIPNGVEEECEKASCTAEVPIFSVTDHYDDIYPRGYIQPSQYINNQTATVQQDFPDYDIDSEDERWIRMQSEKMNITVLKFEEMMDRLDKGSWQTVVTLEKAKSLCKEADDITIAVYEYWLNKRLTVKCIRPSSAFTASREDFALRSLY